MKKEFIKKVIELGIYQTKNYCYWGYTYENKEGKEIGTVERAALDIENMPIWGTFEIIFEKEID